MESAFPALRQQTKDRLEELRQKLNDECISLNELLELLKLQGLADNGQIEEGDNQLLEAAGVREGEYSPTGHLKFTQCSLPTEVANASPEEQNEFYRKMFLEALPILEKPEPSGVGDGSHTPLDEDDGWYSWATAKENQPLPDNAPASLLEQHPDGWIPGFDFNWMTKGGDWGNGEGEWSEHNPELVGWDLWIAATTLEWYRANTVNTWQVQNQCETLAEARARKLPNGEWEVEIIDRTPKPVADVYTSLDMSATLYHNPSMWELVNEGTFASELVCKTTNKELGVMIGASKVTPRLMFDVELADGTRKLLTTDEEMKQYGISDYEYHKVTLSTEIG